MLSLGYGRHAMEKVPSSRPSATVTYIPAKLIEEGMDMHFGLV